MRRAAQRLAVAVFCLHASLLGSCGKVVTTVGETSELRSVAGAGSFGTSGAGSGNGGTHGSGNAAGSSAGSGTMQSDGGIATEVPSGDGKCTFESLAAERRPLEMYVLLDSNITLVNGVWQLAVDGLRTFTRDPRAAGTYFGFHSFGRACDAATYQSPEVDVDMLPNNADLLDAKTDNPGGIQSSPMLPALGGGVAFEVGRAVSNPDLKHVVTVISDGFAGDLSFCPAYTREDVAAVAAEGLAKDIQTYVLVIKNPLDTFMLDTFFGLNEIAVAGGTGAPIDIDNGRVGPSTTEALHTVRRRAQPCEYLLPGTIDPERVGMALLPSAMGTGEIPRVTDAAGCGAEDGWYFNDPALPASMFLCPASCEKLQADDSHTAHPLQGCKPATR